MVTYSDRKFIGRTSLVEFLLSRLADNATDGFYCILVCSVLAVLDGFCP